MSETQFRFRRADEDPLTLESDPEPVASAPLGDAGPLYLDRDVAPRTRPGRGSLPLILASIAVFLLAAAATALVLGPPDALRGLLKGNAPPPAAQPAPLAATPAPDPAEAAAAQAAKEAAAAAEEIATVEPPPAAEPPPRVRSPEPKAEAAPPKPVAKPKPKPKPAAKAAAEKKPVKEISPPPKKPQGLDLDALERSLN